MSDPHLKTPPGAVDLSADPFADDLHEELAAAAPKRWRNRATLALGALALLVGGFLGGVLTEKHFGASATTDARNAAIQQFLNGGGAGGFGGRNRGTGASAAPTPAASGSGSGSGSATVQTNSGTIKLIDGTTVYVGLASGDVLTVQTTSATKINVASATRLSQLRAGQSVTVTGPTDASGDVTATSITAGP